MRKILMLCAAAVIALSAGAHTMIYPLRQAWAVSGYVAFNRYSPKEVGIDLLWKTNVEKNLYFNAGLEFGFVVANTMSRYERTFFEAGIPLQLELGKLNFQLPSLYGFVGITPSYYATLVAKTWDGSKGGYVNSPSSEKGKGFLVAPQAEVGGNLPLGNVIVRLGIYFKYKFDCASGDYTLKTMGGGLAFFGTRIGVIF